MGKQVDTYSEIVLGLWKSEMLRSDEEQVARDSMLRAGLCVVGLESKELGLE